MYSWDELQNSCNNCQRCPLGKTRKNLVFGSGNRDADIMLVGEAPGQVEDETGEPFVGPAGQLLTDMLLIMGLSRDEVYITNILKCRPPNNRDPFADEQNMCIDYLRNQTALIKPKIIICLGRIAAMRIISPDFKITRDHGKITKRGNYMLTALYHPSALLRDDSKRPETFVDLKNIKKLIGEIRENKTTED